MRISSLLLVSVIYCISCNNTGRQYKSPQGYDFSQVEKFAMPAVLSEISGIAFSKVGNDTIYAEQDEEGKLFHFKPGDKNITSTKFAKKGDYEDLAICDNTVIMLRSDGTLFSFPLNTAADEETDSVQEWKGIIPEGEYEGMYADDSSNIYVLCKNCGGKQTNGYILKLTGSNIATAGNFIVDTKAIEELTGEKKIKFHPSALAKNLFTNEWYILSSVNKLLVTADNNWNIKNAYRLNPTLFNQPEGIAFDKEGNLFISNEAGDTGEGTILKFNYKKQ
ncbi:SdiA-regulated domain-containing protein [Ferruginibacter profundus]